MSFDANRPIRRRIAIVGGGISGLASAYLLCPDHDITIYEAAPRLGGHARTVMAGKAGDQPVDTGFIVFNFANYPHLTRMFHDLDVPLERSDMSFGATIDNGAGENGTGGRVEYGLQTFGALLGQRRNLMRPAFAGMVRDIMRFNSGAEAAVRDDTMTIGELVDEMRLGAWFQNYYLMPICGAIWSTPTKDVRDFPARALVSFFRNHGLLGINDQQDWWTVTGGSTAYVERLLHHLQRAGVTVNTGAPVQAVRRHEAGQDAAVSIIAKGHDEACFDEVILACHSDQALAMLEAPTPQEQKALSAIRYQDNEMVLHRDPAQMPRTRACWSSWVYRANGTGDAKKLGVTYWMNRLQNIPNDDLLLVSLNPPSEVPEPLIYDQKTFHHPVFDNAALKAQWQIGDIQGDNNTWFAGAYLRHGFHEDGFASAMRIAQRMEQVIA